MAGCGGSGASHPEGSTQERPDTGVDETTAAEPQLADPELFAYDAAAATDVRVKKVVSRGGVDVADVVLDQPERRVPAYLVAPHGKADGPAVLFLHWLASEPSSNRTEFLDEARALAREGVVSLLPDQLFPWHDAPSDPGHDKELVVRQIVELRRALDVLAGRPGVDPARIGVVGHDYGGMYGTLLAAFDRRPATYVVMAADTDFPNWFVKYFVKGGRVPEYEAAFAGLDPVDAVAEAAPASVFLQFGESDSYVPYYRANELFEATSEPKRMEKYDGGHELDEVARKDRLAWLREQLQIGS
jgi:dienelactone hydrolase